MAETAGRPRPSRNSFHFMTDTNAGPNNIQVTHQRNLRPMIFPQSRACYDIDCCRRQHRDAWFVKFSDDTSWKFTSMDALASDMPGNDNDSIVEPTITGSVDIATDVNRNTSVKQLHNMRAVDHLPNSGTPNTSYEHRDNGDLDVGSSAESTQSSNDRSVVENFSATVSDSGVIRVLNDPGTWKGRQISDAFIRAKLGGWTGGRDARESTKEQDKIWKKIHSGSKKRQPVDTGSTPTCAWRDEAALRYIYTPTTQRHYEDIDWDMELPPRMLPYASTLEKLPDQVSHQFTVNKRYEPMARQYQNLGRSWDLFQSRDGHYIRGPIEFCSHSRKNLQIPNYKGCIGGEGDSDDPHKVFRPMTVLRTSVPKYTNTAHRANIPKYTGCTHWTSELPANINVPQPPPQTTARVHRYLPISPNNSSHKKTSRMSRMITLVPPGNPFN